MQNIQPKPFLDGGGWGEGAQGIQDFSPPSELKSCNSPPHLKKSFPPHLRELLPLIFFRAAHVIETFWFSLLL